MEKKRENCFKTYETPNFAGVNKEVLKLWQDEGLFAKSIEARRNAPSFVFYEGPPSANGMPGIHHVIARSLKDIFCRYKTMRGFLVERRAGWDTHGLPVELGVEKALGITKEDIGKKISIRRYNDECRKAVMRYTKEWEQLTEQMGYWVDMNEPYITYKPKYMETLWWLLADLYKKGLLYKGYTIQPYSPAAGTGLSSHELNQPGCYRDVKDTVCTAQFKITDVPASWGVTRDCFFLAWTTTPWTLPSNTALCVGDNIEYALIETFNPYSLIHEYVVLATARIPAYFDAANETADMPETWQGETKQIPWKRIATMHGSDLAGLHYEQLIPWVKPMGDAFRVITGDYVTTEDGTGIVHIAPTFGQDDQRVAQKAGIGSLLLIDKEGNQRPMVDLRGRFFPLNELDAAFRSEYMDEPLYDVYAGRYVKNDYDDTLKDSDETLDVDLCVMLKLQNKAFKIGKHVHSYPHCWRTDKPVLYYPLDSWFIRTTACREAMMKLNETIRWKPETIGTGRFGKWLENLQDWNLSRSRFWGTPLNIWRTEDGSEERCIASIEELYNEIERSIQSGLMRENPFKGFVPGDMSDENYAHVDLHRPVVDEIVLTSAQGKPMYREKDLIDVWFDSGAMPFAQLHYPFENKEAIDERKFFPADFIAEGIDQTRGWFFTLHAIATMVKESVAYKNVLANGLVQDKNGNKMSKRLGNAVDPFIAIDEYGADPLRWYMITNASPWDNIKFDVDGVKEVSRKFFGTLYNTYQFFALYANLDHFDPDKEATPYAQRPEIDRWILSMLHSLIDEVTASLEDYEPTRAGRAIEDFVETHLSNWYVRLSRKRFWVGDMTVDKECAYATLYECLVTVAKLMAPIAPFYADRLYRDLTLSDESVHLTDFPVANKEVIDAVLERRMARAQALTGMVLALRRKVNIKVRQPLSSIMVLIDSEEKKNDIEAVSKWILNEVNVKEIRYEDASADIWHRTIKPDFKKLGPRYGKIMKALAQQIASLSQDEITRLDKEGQLNLQIGNDEVQLLRDDVTINVEDIPGRLVATDGHDTVALDVTVSDELYVEGLARELVNRIQNLRKQMNFEVNDHIDVFLLEGTEMDRAVNTYHDYISEQVQADELALSDAVSDGTDIDMESYTLTLSISKSER